MNHLLVRLFIGCISLFFATGAIAATYKVSSIEEYENVASSLSAGDTVVLKNGIWENFQIKFSGKGAANAPITLKAETPGKVVLSGQSNIALAGHHLVVEGLYFKNGYSPTRSVIAFKHSKTSLAYHSRVTQTVIENFNDTEKFGGAYWVEINGQYNRFDHNALIGKSTSGVTLAVRLNNENSQQNHHRIEHNYFGYRPTLGSNGGETLRIGTSHYSLTDSFTQVKHNYFEKTNGEVEIISVKSGKNTISNNTFYEAAGTLTLRHGNGNILSNNVFFGNGQPHTGGIRVINGDQIVENNYHEGLTGFRFGGGFSIMNGVPNSRINRYHQVDNAKVSNNTFIDVDYLQFAVGSDAERSAVPINSQFSNNLISHNERIDGIKIFDDISGISFSGNVANNVTEQTLTSGIENTKFSLIRADNGLLYPSEPSLANKGVSRDLMPTKKADTGPKWYTKPVSVVPFAQGKEHKVTNQDGALLAAIHQANDGDVLLLSNDHHVISQTLSINKVLTIRGQANTKITFERPTLFVIEDSGSLALEQLLITGEDAPDSAGNVLIRNTRMPTNTNYRLHLDKVTINDLDVNHSFHVFDSGYRAFADQIKISNSHFNNITGDILRLNKEQDDLGIYNAEYVTLTNNHFKQIQGTLMNVYRGGTDESTFGPHVSIVNNQIINVGKGKRNKSKAVITLHGAQVTNIENNRFNNTPPIIIEHTVAEPKTIISGNIFSNTPAPQAAELFTKGPITAVIKNNQFETLN